MCHIKYPIGIQTFSKIIRGGYAYVDKTSFIPVLLESGQYIFLSRPRRFGKSLLLSMLHSYFEGDRELFRGLAIDSMDVDWTPRPVIHIDLNSENYTKEDGLENRLDASLKIYEEKYGIQAIKKTPALRFEDIIRYASEGDEASCVILIDEYDKPLFSLDVDSELFKENQALLKSFYGVLKSMDRYIRFAMLTGVARFSKVSIFSDLNNLRDISFEERFAAICGITSDELDRYFHSGVEAMAEKEGVSYEEVRVQLKRAYDGYHFAKVSPDIFNPFSLINVFGKQEFGSYWFETGTPSYLVRLVELEEWPLRGLAPTEIEAKQLEASGLLSRDPVPAFYQTGYLTIKAYDPLFKTYTLDYPNEEVRDGFVSFLIPYYIKPERRGERFSIKECVIAVQIGRPMEFMELLESMIAGIPYSEKGSAEDHFQNATYILFTLMGHYVLLEDRTSDGRIDLTVETSQYVYIFEFKVDSTAEAAMEQIHRKRYWLKYGGSGKVIYLIGANFNTKTKRLDPPLIEKM
ncbi:MAG: ATP-binding protein [Muribaculaceae bacterium]|nr:ATP-binding protein [Muribaculaceae bacterium]